MAFYGIFEMRLDTKENQLSKILLLPLPSHQINNIVKDMR